MFSGSGVYLCSAIGCYVVVCLMYICWPKSCTIIAIERSFTTFFCFMDIFNSEFSYLEITGEI